MKELKGRVTPDEHAAAERFAEDNGVTIAGLTTRYHRGVNSYPVETLDEDYDDGTMPKNVADLGEAVIGRRIVSVEQTKVPGRYYGVEDATVLTLDNGQRVELVDTDDCCAFTTFGGVLPAPGERRPHDPRRRHHGRLHDLAHLRRLRRRDDAQGRVVERQPLLLRLRVRHSRAGRGCYRNCYLTTGPRTSPAVPQRFRASPNTVAAPPPPVRKSRSVGSNVPGRPHRRLSRNA